jgi:hypothetical protein
MKRLPATAALFAGLAVIGAATPAEGDGYGIPRLGFSEFGWFPVSDDFTAPAEGPGPVMSDPAHPYYSNQSGRQPTDRVADLTNPILKPWVVDRLKKANEATLAGHVPYSPRETCWPAGVPDFDVFSRLRPVYFLQTRKEVAIINEGDQQVRRVYLDVPHSNNLKPSWYGESVGHYENGDTLVVDTVGLSDRTFVDNYLTPHTTALHVVERFRLMPDGKTLQLSVKVEDPGTFNTTWSARQTLQKRPQEKMQEAVCAENNVDFFGKGYVPVPESKQPDF